MLSGFLESISFLYNAAFLSISFLIFVDKSPLSSEKLQFAKESIHFLVKIFISKASDLTSFVRKRIEIFILSIISTGNYQILLNNLKPIIFCEGQGKN